MFRVLSQSHIVCLLAVSRSELEGVFTRYDLKRLELYSQNMVDYHLIMDLLPSLSQLHFLYKIDVQLSAIQEVCTVYNPGKFSMKWSGKHFSCK